MSYVREALTQARELVARGWTQGSYAVDADGAEVPATDDTAVHFCVVGAVKRVTRHMPIEECSDVFKALANGIGGAALIAWNDAELRTQDEAIALFDKAIANA